MSAVAPKLAPDHCMGRNSHSSIGIMENEMETTIILGIYRDNGK